MTFIYNDYEYLILDKLIIDSLSQFYSEPHRHYHNLSHVYYLLETHKNASKEYFSPYSRLVTEVCIWFHDCIYDPKNISGENEKLSAILAKKWVQNTAKLEGNLEGLRFRLANECYETIMGTKTHSYDKQTEWVQYYFYDLDLSILASDPAVYAEYCKNIRKEYSFVPDSQYKKGRSKILTSFLRRKHVFQTLTFASFENQARKNLEEELRLLSCS